MALGRETVGTAYVRILADGSRLDESIKREMRDHGDTMSGIGQEGAEGYAEGWEEEFDKGASRQKLRDGVKNALAKNDGVDAYLHSPKWEETKPRLRTQFGEAGEVAGANLAERLIESANFEEFNARVRNLVPEISSATKEITEREKKWERDWRSNLDKITNATGRSIREIESDMDSLANKIDSVGLAMHRQSTDIDREWVHTSETIRREMDKTDKKTEGFVGKLDDVGDAVGRAFGKGSRNNFINFVGSFVGGLARLPAALVKVGQKVTDFGEKMATTFTDAGGGLAGIGAVAAKIGPQLAAAGAGFVALAALVGIATSAFWLLLGAVTALISSITFGLMGALAPLVGMIAPISLAVGALAAALIGMDDKTKKLMKEAVKPLIQDLKDLGDAARPGILRGLQKAVENLHKPTQRLEPVFAAAGNGIGRFADKFSDAVTGPGFTMFVNVMTRQLPRELGILGNALGHVFDGFTGALASLNRKGGPVEQFLGWLSGITQTFDDWTTMKAVAPSIDLAGGIKTPAAAPQTGFEKWMQGIQESADALEGVLSPLWDIIRQLMNAGKPAGDSLMESLGNTLQDLADWMQEHPDDVQQWMSDSADFARALGDLALAFGDLAAALDTPGGRKAATFLLKMSGLTLGVAAGSLVGFAAAVGLVANIDWNKLGNDIDGAFRKIRGALSGKIEIPGGLGIDWRDVIGAPSAIRSLAQTTIVKAFTGLAGVARNAIGKMDLSGIVGGVGKVFQTVVGPFRGLAKDALLRIGTFNIADIIVGLGGVARQIFNAFPSANEILHSIGTFNIMDVVEGLASVASNIFGAFPSAQEILNSIGHIDLSSLLHGSFTLPGGHKISYAGGGVVFGPRFGLMGEAGPEAIVPLARPLHLVDPAVRELSAIAQGLQSPRMASGGVVVPQKVIDVGGINIITPTVDPAAVAQETINRLVAVGY